MIRTILSLLILFASVPAFAQVPNMCGSQVDLNLHTGGAGNGTGGSCGAGKVDSVLNKLHGYSTQGCVTLCPSGIGDQDVDGYSPTGATPNIFTGSTSIDCDDTRADIFPGVYTAEGCGASEAKLCNTDGTYGACTAWSSIDQSTNGGGRVYVNVGGGSDGNPGTYASPFATVNACVDAISGAGGVCYIYGTGTDTTAVTIGASGTSSHPRRLIRLPGSTAKIAVASGIGIDVDNYNYWYFDNLDVDGGSAAIDMEFATSVEGSRLYLHDGEHNGNNNHSIWRSQHSDTIKLHHSILRNAINTSGNNVNNSLAMYLDNEASGEGFGHEFKFNVLFNDSYNTTTGTGGINLKHNTFCSDLSSCTLGLQAYANIIANHGNDGGVAAIGGGQSGLRAMYNRIYGGADSTPAFGFGDGGNSPHSNEDNRIQYNTIYRGSVSWNYPYYSGDGESLLFDHNILINERSSYTDCGGIVSIDPYGQDSYHALTQAGDPLIDFDYNCYYSPNATAQFCYYGQSSGSSGGRPAAGSAGAQYTFANWKNVSNVAGPQDANSALIDPQLATDSWLPAEASCSTFGWTSTTTTSTTTTLAATRAAFIAGIHGY